MIENLVGEALERLVHALGGLLGGGEIFHAGTVGGVLLRAHVRQERVLQHRLRRGQRRNADLVGAGDAAAGGRHQRAGAQDHRQDRLRGGGLNLLAHARQMTAGDVAGLMGEHADHLIRRFGFHQRAGIDEDAPSVRHEGVERAMVDDDDLDVLLGEAGGAQDRLRIFAQQLFDLGVADDRGPGPPAALRLRLI